MNQSSEAAGKRTGLLTYLRQSKEELEKVSWPSRSQAVRYAGMVIGATVALAAFVAALDWALALGFERLIDFANV
ncbi:MAG TPA: preprotein translocase subunit SecE [Patescibacteria group bacterium]|nr:preprotein translocase subunit SecE [Patescibacteria group bacterium]